MPELLRGLRLLDVALGVSAIFFLQRILAILRAKSRSQSYKLPPGPTPLPLVGNLFDLPKDGDKEWLHWAKHKDLYGPISSVTVFGQPLIILNDRQMAIDLFEKRSALYSDRPVFNFGGEMCGWREIITLQHYGPYLQAMRKHVYKVMGTPKILARFNDLITLETRRFLYQVNEAPDSLDDHIRSTAGAIILNLAYGYRINQKSEDPLVKLADKAMQQFSESTCPGKWLVDVAPALHRIPDWFPGARFKWIAKEYQRMFNGFKDKPHAFVKEQMASNREGVATPSFTADLLESEAPTEENDAMIKQTAVTLFAGGADTTVSSLNSFFLAMALYQDVQKRAQAELDAVIGTGRLPAFEDSTNLPYLDALIKETHRWNPVAPMGFAHVTAEDDVYNGYFIPKGAPLLPNVWQFTHDPAEYPDPLAFKPDRYLASPDHAPERDPREMTFGYGRRVCPGRELANASTFLTVSMVLAVFDISLPKDENGREVRPHVEYTSGVLSHPTKFQCVIVPRSEKATNLIRSIEIEHPLDSGDSEKLLQLDNKQRQVKA